ncbi:AGAP002106-PA-like protein [Anopheles sinensis]|uniref:AGAP002106-PA-like protein n=1 Tax=Anopheles sinensis TaxID=74873 RepID=A0A084W9U1_ANOSI|nr:AGAP002106-PA-like protein [Anopheles sinensis]
MEAEESYTDVENQKDAESASSVDDFSASEDEWIPDKLESPIAAKIVLTGKPSKKRAKKPTIPLKPARVSRRIAAKNGITLPEETEAEAKEQLSTIVASSSDSEDSDSEGEKKPPKKVKRKTARTKAPAKRKQRKKDQVEIDEEPIKLTTFTVEQLYRKYRPDLAHPLPQSDKPGPSKGLSSKRSDENGDNRDSESSGDDYLVDPSELDLDSEFFRPTEQESEQRKAVDLFFDCNAGVELTDSEDDNETKEAMLVGAARANQHHSTDAEMGKKLIQQINQSSEAFVQMMRLAEAATSIAAKSSVPSKDATSSGENGKPSSSSAPEDIDRLLVAGEKIPNRGGRSLTTGFGRQDFVAVAPTKPTVASDAPKDIEITLKLGPDNDSKGRPPETYL